MPNFTSSRPIFPKQFSPPICSWGTAYGLPVFPNLDEAAEDQPGDAVKALLARLGQLAERANVDTEFHAVTGPPAEAIVQAASKLGADLVVIGNKAMRGANRVLGSIPNSIAHHARCSVLIVDTTKTE